LSSKHFQILVNVSSSLRR